MNSIHEQRTGEQRRRDDDGVEGARFRMGTVATIVMVVISALVAYFASVNTVNARVSVLESQQQLNGQRLERIEDKMDRLLERSQP